MRGGVRFADVLEDKLRAIEWATPTSDQPQVRPAPPRYVVYTPLYNLHTMTHGVGTDRVAPPASGADIRGAAIAAPGQGVEHWTGAGEPSRPRIDSKLRDAAPDSKAPEFQPFRPPVAAPAQPCRRLTAAQWRSLDLFNQLGAGVRADFSAGELRSAFRALARRYHPDRHPCAASPIVSSSRNSSRPSAPATTRCSPRSSP